MTNILPEGFTLDTPKASAALPEGFTLDAPAAAPQVQLSPFGVGASPTAPLPPSFILPNGALNTPSFPDNAPPNPQAAPGALSAITPAMLPEGLAPNTVAAATDNSYSISKNLEYLLVNINMF